jgi:hypothetical protein
VPDLPEPPGGGIQTFVGVHEGRPYCLQVEPWGGRIRPDLLDDGFDPGTCEPYAKYGQPGPAISTWLEAGAIRFGTRRGPQAVGPRVARSWFEEVDAPIFGLKRDRLLDSSPAGGRCMAGDAGACLLAFLAPEIGAEWDADRDYIVANSPATHMGRSIFVSARNRAEAHLFADLEGEFGTQAFSRFWTSEEAVPRAFESAFGEDAGAWMLRWVHAEIGAHQPGPGLRAGTPLLAILTLMALAATVSFMATRRRVG